MKDQELVTVGSIYKLAWVFFFFFFGIMIFFLLYGRLKEHKILTDRVYHLLVLGMLKFDKEVACEGQTLFDIIMAMLEN